LQESIALRNLEELAIEGYDPRQVLEQSILSQWVGLYPIRSAKKARSQRRNLAAISESLGQDQLGTDIEDSAPREAHEDPKGPPLPGTRELWRLVLDAARNNGVDPGSWETWLRPTQLHGFDEGVAIVRCPTAEFKRELSERCQVDLISALKACGHDVRDVKFFCRTGSAP
jgi:hypothetical protein